MGGVVMTALRQLSLSLACGADVWAGQGKAATREVIPKDKTNQRGDPTNSVLTMPDVAEDTASPSCFMNGQETLDIGKSVDDLEWA